MIEFVNNPKGEVARSIFDTVKDKLGAPKASNWMFSANTWLDGRTPIQAIKDGDHEAAIACAEKVTKSPPTVPEPETVNESDEICPF